MYKGHTLQMYVYIHMLHAKLLLQLRVMYLCLSYVVIHTHTHGTIRDVYMSPQILPQKYLRR